MTAEEIRPPGFPIKRGETVAVFFDEGGDPTVPGMTPYFVNAAVLFPTREHIEQIEEAIKTLKNSWGRKLKNNEFKFAELDHDQRTAYFTAIGDLTFKHGSCVLDKQTLGGNWRKKSYVWERTVLEVVNRLEPFLRELDVAQENPLRVRVYCDHHSDRKYALRGCSLAIECLPQIRVDAVFRANHLAVKW